MVDWTGKRKREQRENDSGRWAHVRTIICIREQHGGSSAVKEKGSAWTAAAAGRVAAVRQGVARKQDTVGLGGAEKGGSPGAFPPKASRTASHVSPIRTGG
ncbi:hypothetical protein AAL_01690 [Moelleriella libera RCEF 2490]|uniref:Uncharacterized protein n=1 Tax=Moelleriella libera RCEF 2490 TaxID=1081109 RepID=A0A166UD01_9HYPO|nr:hypothetical protein AAL_01690 [Moelleriella libera RCEF 2490]